MISGDPGILQGLRRCETAGKLSLQKSREKMNRRAGRLMRVGPFGVGGQDILHQLIGVGGVERVETVEEQIPLGGFWRTRV